MVIGGFLGAAVWRLGHDLPAVPHSPAPFVVVGMIACFGSIAHAPLAVMLMVAEMTGSLEMLAPAMIAVGVATVVVGDRTIYRSQLRNRTEAPAHRLRFGLPLLASLPVSEAMRPPPVVLTEDRTAAEAIEELTEARVLAAPVAGPGDIFEGSVDKDRLTRADPGGPVGSLVDGGTSAVPEDATLDAVADVFAAQQVGWVPVLDPQRRIVGVVGTGDLIGAYRDSLARSLRSLRSVFPGSVLVEEEVRPRSAVSGLTVAEAPWPPGTVVVSIQRAGQLIFPEPRTEVRPEDVLSVLAPRGSEERLRRSLGPSSSGSTDDDEPMI
jgi:CBS domain-containing protein